MSLYYVHQWFIVYLSFWTFVYLDSVIVIILSCLSMLYGQSVDMCQSVVCWANVWVRFFCFFEHKLVVSFIKIQIVREGSSIWFFEKFWNVLNLSYYTDVDQYFTSFDNYILFTIATMICFRECLAKDYFWLTKYITRYFRLKLLVQD